MKATDIISIEKQARRAYSALLNEWADTNAPELGGSVDETARLVLERASLGEEAFPVVRWTLTGLMG